MKQSILLCLIFVLSFATGSYSQEIVPMPPIDLSKCEGETFMIWPRINPDNKVKIRFDQNCSRFTEYNLPNWEEFIISGGTLVDQQRRDFPTGSPNEANGEATLYFKATENATITISTTQRKDVVYENSACPDMGRSSTTTHIYTFRLKVTRKKAPQLTANKKVVQTNGEQVMLQAIGCDPSDYHIQQFAPYCDDLPLPDKNDVSGVINTEEFNRPRPLGRSQTFYVRCYNAGCVSEWSDPVRIEALPTSNPCGDPDIEFINSIKENASSDYHYYKVENIVCTKAENPNCNITNVFNFMSSSKAYNAPIAIDMPSVIPGIGPGYANWSAQVPLLGSALVYKLDDSKVNNCDLVSLPSVIGMAFNLVGLSYGVSTGNYNPYLNIRNATPGNGWTANPIRQVIDPNTYSITNYTMKDHAFYPGRVVRKVVEDCETIKVVTIGIGQSEAGNNPLGAFMSGFNAHAGEKLFNNIDQRFIHDFNK